MSEPTSFELTPVGKLFFASLLGWIMNGTKFNWKLKAEPKVAEAFSNVVLASKAFQDEIKRQGATVDTVIEKLNAKTKAASEFEAATGQKWPL
jgi:hypothetical protein